MTAYHPPKATDEWATPSAIFDPLNAEFDFDLDPCASDLNAKCAHYFTQAQNGLAQDWSGRRVFMNPPYGRAIRHWVAKARESGVLVVGLLPARTDTAWFHDHINGVAEVRFLKGRVYFESPGFKRDRAPFPSLVAIWRP